MTKNLGLFLLTLGIAAAPATLRAEHREARAERGARRLASVMYLRQIGTAADDSVTYRNARSALNDGNYQMAATNFRRLRVGPNAASRWPDAGYWEAFALYRIGDEQNLRDALAALDDARKRFPNAPSKADAATLETRIRGQLAKLGDPNAMAHIVGDARGEADGSGETGERPAEPGKGTKGVKPPKGEKRVGRSDPGCTTRGGGDDDESSDARIAALNALLQMDDERAIPILRDVLARRDECSEVLRRKAVFLVAQHDTPESADILLAAARTDPDREVRRQAIFWLSQVHSTRATTALDSILHATNGDPDLREKAIFALSQQNRSDARQTLRDFAKSDAPVELRRKAVFWLGQQDHSADNAAFLRSLYDSPNGAPLRDEIIQAAANDDDSAEWLLSVARDPKQDVGQRKKALFWLGQQRHVPVSEFVSLYDKLTDRDVKEHLIFVLSQRREKAAVDKLFDIARSDSDRELRGKAIFWLGQSNDPRVQQFLMEIINK